MKELEKGSRIIGKTADISYDSVQSFFDERSKSENKKHKYNYVMYLDEQPEIAVERDRQAKERVSELLSLAPGMSVLDIGCGIGRWGELFCQKGLFYYGIDGSAQMIERAEENLREYPNKKLFVGNARFTEKALRQNSIDRQFDIVIMSGVLMYLNDDDVIAVLKTINQITEPNGQICFIESMSDKERLTLKDIYSEELKQNYSAIYRSVDEFISMMEEAFSDKYVLKCNEVLDFSDGFQKKRTHVTREHCVIWGKA